jgi:trimeric autotransporter adhesin
MNRHAWLCRLLTGLLAFVSIVSVPVTSAAGSTSFACDKTIVVGGDSLLCTVTLGGPAPSGGANVTLSSSNPAVAGNPSPWNVAIPAGASTLTLTVATRPVSSTTSVTISGPAGGSAPGVTLSVLGPALSNVTFSPPGPAGGNPSTGTVTLNGPALSSEILSISLSSNSAAASVPASVTVATGKTTATFTVTTHPVEAPTFVTISARRHLSTSSKTATLSVAPPALRGFICNPAKGSATSICTVTLTGPAPWGATVNLSSSNPAVVTIAATVRMTSATANVITKTKRVSSPTIVDISASYGGKSFSDSVTVTQSGVETP